MSTTMMVVLYLAAAWSRTTLAVGAADPSFLPAPARPTSHDVCRRLRTLWPVVLIGLVHLGVIVAVARQIGRLPPAHRTLIPPDASSRRIPEQMLPSCEHAVG